MSSTNTSSTNTPKPLSNLDISNIKQGYFDFDNRDVIDLSRYDDYLLKNNIYRQFYSLYYIYNGGDSDSTIVNGQFIVNNDPYIFNIPQCFNKDILFNFYEFSKTNQPSIELANKQLYSATKDLPFKNNEKYIAFQQMFKNPILLDSKGQNNFFKSMILSLLNDAGYKLNSQESCRVQSQCFNDSIIGLWNKYEKTNDVRYLKEIGDVSGLSGSETFTQLVQNQPYGDAAVYNLLTKLGYNIPSESSRSKYPCKEVTETDLVKYKSIMKNITKQNGKYSIPQELCVSQFFNFIKCIKYCNFKKVEVQDNSLVVVSTNTVHDIKESERKRHYYAMKGVIHNLSQVMDFDDMMYAISMSNFIHDDIPMLIYEIEKFDTILCTLIAVAVLKYKFNILIDVQLSYLYYLFHVINKTSFNTECCGVVTISNKFCPIDCKFRIPMNTSFYNECIKYLITLPKTFDEYKELIMKTKINQHILKQLFNDDKSDASYFVAFLLLGYKLPDIYSKKLSKYVKDYKFNPITSYKPSDTVLLVCDLFRTFEKNYILESGKYNIMNMTDIKEVMKCYSASL